MTLIYFPTKLMFLSYRVGIWHPSKLPIHTMSLYILGDYFFKSCTVLKTAVVYDKYKPNLCLVYAWCFSINCVFTEEIITKLPWLVWTNMYICIPMLGTSHNPLKSMVYWAVIYVYVRYMHVIYLQLDSSAGACQSSTARCWSNKHGCPCVMIAVIPCV